MWSQRIYMVHLGLFVQTEAHDPWKGWKTTVFDWLGSILPRGKIPHLCRNYHAHYADMISRGLGLIGSVMSALNLAIGSVSQNRRGHQNMADPDSIPYPTQSLPRHGHLITDCTHLYSISWHTNNPELIFALMLTFICNHLCPWHGNFNTVIVHFSCKMLKEGCWVLTV